MAEPTIKCDKCGERFPMIDHDLGGPHDYKYAVPEDWLILRGLGMTSEQMSHARSRNLQPSAHHLCPACAKQLKRWIEQEPPAQLPSFVDPSKL